jgi:phage head maturation protease
VSPNEPILTDAFIHDVYGLWNHDAAYRDGVVHADVIKDRLRRSSRRILGDENVTDVLLQVVDQGPM